jgi:hypothetical protein
VAAQTAQSPSLTTLSVAVGVSLAALAATPGCAAPVDEDAGLEGEDTGELSTSRDTYVVLRRDLRKCAAPACGGYWIKDANREAAETYVASIDLGGLEELARVQAEDADAEQLVLWGRLGRLGAGNVRPFLAKRAWRGLPGFAPKSSDGFATVTYIPIRCVTAPCNGFTATRLNTGTKTSLTSVDLAKFENASLNPEWLRDRVEHGAIVAARTTQGRGYPGGRERIYDVSQVYLALPEVRQACPAPAVAKCAAGFVSNHAVDANSCLSLAGCFPAVACPKIARMCGEGYREVVRFAPPNACEQLVCEPEFMGRCGGQIPPCAAPPRNCNYVGAGCVAGHYTCGTLECNGDPEF